MQHHCTAVGFSQQTFITDGKLLELIINELVMDTLPLLSFLMITPWAQQQQKKTYLEHCGEPNHLIKETHKGAAPESGNRIVHVYFR